MLTRFSVRTAMLCALATAAAVPAVATAAPRHNRGLTIAATPNHILAGTGVLIYGRLSGANVANRRIYLYHRINPKTFFSVVSVTRTDAHGFYEFTRAEGIVNSNRNWYVVGPRGKHSRTMHERVAPTVTLAPSQANATTAQPVTFTGSVSPVHRGQRVLIQKQDSANGNHWVTVARGVTGAASSFTITHSFRSPGDYALRAYFPGDRRNIAGSSDSLALPVQQRENPNFTINTSSPLAADGQPVTISGTLGITPKPNLAVTLYGRALHGGFRALASTTTGADGSYSFTQTPDHNTVYRVETTAGPRQHTAHLFQGVQDTLSFSASASSVAAGAAVTFSGGVSPDHAGHVIYLQQQTASGSWQIIGQGTVGAGSRYTISTAFGRTGTHVVRARIYGGPRNVGGASTPMTVTVTGYAPATQLPPAS